MDEQLRQLQRVSLQDADAKDKYLRMLERLLGLDQKPLTLYVVFGIHARSVHLTLEDAQNHLRKVILNLLDQQMSHADPVLRKITENLLRCGYFSIEEVELGKDFQRDANKEKAQ